MGSIVKYLWLIPLSLWLFISGCAEEVKPVQQIYSNDFSGELTSITGGKTINVDNNTLLGNYNLDGFELHLTDLPEHNYISVEFDFYAHDSWDGNPVSDGGPDLWWFTVERDAGFVGGDYQFTTTFSNTPCPHGLYCKRQSYPNPYPFAISSRTEAIRTMNGLCWFADEPDGTTMYHIRKIVSHTDDELKMTFRDSLKQFHVVEKLCDESWSIDNLEIFAWE